MKTLTTLLLAIFLVVGITGCASSPVAPGTKATIASIRPEIEIVRNILRPTITVFAQKYGVPVDATTTVFAVIDPAIDSLLNDGTFDGVTLDETTWTAIRAKAVDKLSGELAKASYKGVAIVPDKATAAALVGPFFDSFAVQVKALLKSHSAPAPAPVTTPVVTSSSQAR